MADPIRQRHFEHHTPETIAKCSMMLSGNCGAFRIKDCLRAFPSVSQQRPVPPLTDPHRPHRHAPLTKLLLAYRPVANTDSH